MSTPISVDDIATRLMSFPHDRYLYIGGFMRSVVWAVATVVLLEIIARGRDYRLRLVPWLVSLLATMVTLMTWGRGVLLTNSRATLLDSVLPTLMGVIEFCLFAVLAPQMSDSENKDRKIDLFNYWFFVLALHALLAVLLVGNRIANTSVTDDFAQELRPLANEYVGWMYADLIGASAGFIMFSIFGWLTLRARRKSGAFPKKLFARLSIVPIVIYLIVMIQAQSQYQRTDQVISGLMPAASSTPAANRGTPTPTP